MTTVTNQGASISSAVVLTASNASSTYTYSTDAPLDRDDRVGLAPLEAETALRGLLMTREIEADPEEVASLRRSQAQYEEGETDCLADGESVAAHIDSDD